MQQKGFYRYNSSKRKSTDIIGARLHGAQNLVTKVLGRTDLCKTFFLQFSLVKLILRLPMSYQSLKKGSSTHNKGRESKGHLRVLQELANVIAIIAIVIVKPYHFNPQKGLAIW